RKTACFSILEIGVFSVVSSDWLCLPADFRDTRICRTTRSADRQFRTYEHERQRNLVKPLSIKRRRVDIYQINFWPLTT
ncbi:uncharacterized protein EDB91DRAFT_1114890, partial [Suillus paluster]|uniref:uncharacterized protein n=1 Tax=Suillus paluster TaxID=48578 RepID=UPI001B86B8B2